MTLYSDINLVYIRGIIWIWIANYSELEYMHLPYKKSDTIWTPYLSFCFH